MSHAKQYLIFDTETTGMPRNWRAPVSMVSNWPRVVQLAWILIDEAGNEIEKEDKIIRPEGYTIPVAATAIHGITTERALREGVELKLALEAFEAALSQTDTLVAHNIDFDYRVLGAEFYRLKRANPLDDYDHICTMKESTDFCALPGKYGFKWPSLSELHRTIYKRDFADAHNAMIDVEVCKNCFLELRKRGWIDL